MDSRNKSMKMCRDFTRGRCKRGGSCIFVHSLDRRNILDQGTSIGVGVDGNQEKVNERSDDNQDTHTQRDSNAISIQLQPAQFNVRTDPQPHSKIKMCFEWIQYRTCSYAPHCKFAHGNAELEQSTSATGSRFGNTLAASRTQNEDATASNAGNQTAGQKDPKNKWKIGKKIPTIYADWPGDLKGNFPEPQ